MDLSDAIEGRPEGPSEELRKLAEETAVAQDAAREADARIKMLKKALQTRMEEEGVESVALDDRAPIRLVPRKESKVTKGGLIQVLGEEKGEETWKALPTKDVKRLDIPAPSL